MKYEILIVDQKVWTKDINKIPAAVFKTIRKKILQLIAFPEQGDIKKLSDFPIADYRLRVGKWRILFDVDVKRKKVLLYRVLHRKDSYRF